MLIKNIPKHPSQSFKRMMSIILCAAMLISLLTCPTGAAAGEGREASPLAEGDKASTSEAGALILHLSPADTGAAAGGGRNTWQVTASQSLFDVTEGGAMALLLRLRVAEGWQITDVRQSGVIAGLTLTVENYTSETMILLDGAPKCSSVNNCDKNTPMDILKIEVQPTDGNNRTSTDAPPLLTPVPEEDGEIFLYYINKEGKVTARKLQWEVDTGGEGSEETTDLNESTDHTPDAGAQEGTNTGLTTDRPTKAPQDPEEDGTSFGESDGSSESGVPTEPVNRFMGVQVSNPQGGRCAVRFLFCGTGEDTPVVCMDGGDHVTVTVTRADAVEEWKCGERRIYPSGAGEHWLLCTFFGIMEKSLYTFKIYTASGVIDVIFENGRVCYNPSV